MKHVYYNENDPRAAAWLRELIKGGHIASGEVDERSIEDIEPSELEGYAQCHFFAGIGGWSYALRLAGWPDDKPVWTGSCPCQPFSAAGKGKGFADERHLWPAWFQLIGVCRPPVIFGEQVASPAGLAWFDVVHADLEGAQYACAAADLCAAGVGAPHIRQRLYWVGALEHAKSEQMGVPRRAREPRGPGSRLAHYYHLGRVEYPERDGPALQEGRSLGDDTRGRGELRSLAHGGGERLEVLGVEQAREQCEAAERGGAACELADDRLEGRGQVGAEFARRGGGGETEGLEQRSLYSSPWEHAVWIPCRDGKSRPVEPGTFPLAHGVPGRVGLLRGYGNAIVPQVAAAFIQASGLMA